MNSVWDYILSMVITLIVGAVLCFLIYWGFTTSHAKDLAYIKQGMVYQQSGWRKP